MYLACIIPLITSRRGVFVGAAIVAFNFVQRCLNPFSEVFGLLLGQQGKKEIVID